MFLLVILFSSLIINAQPFLSIAATSKGAGLSVGYLDDRTGTEFSAGYNTHFIKADVPALFYFCLGKKMVLSPDEINNYSLTTSIGYAFYSAKDFSNYEKDYGAVIQVKKTKPWFGLELGKDSHLGRLYLCANYCSNTFYGAGLRVFIK